MAPYLCQILIYRPYPAKNWYFSCDLWLQMQSMLYLDPSVSILEFIQWDIYQILLLSIIYLAILYRIHPLRSPEMQGCWFGNADIMNLVREQSFSISPFKIPIKKLNCICLQGRQQSSLISPKFTPAQVLATLPLAIDWKFWLICYPLSGANYWAINLGHKAVYVYWACLVHRWYNKSCP